MSPSEISFLSLSVGALLTFGGALAWASWIENRHASRNP